MLGGILFASTQGSGLDCYAKQWRLLADVMNDIGGPLVFSGAAGLVAPWFRPVGQPGARCAALAGWQPAPACWPAADVPRCAEPRNASPTRGGSFLAFFLLSPAFHPAGLALELASPLLPGAFLLLACLGSLARAVTGVAGSATRMALTQHFALQRNAADIAAKEGSQVGWQEAERARAGKTLGWAGPGS